MERLWAPWRKAYIRPEAQKTKGCLFCRLLAQNRDAQNYILKRTPSSFALLNLYPYNSGHVLVVPKRHVGATETMTDPEKLDWLRLYDEILRALKASLKPHGFNVGLNLGKAGGAGVTGHLHLHVVPRWKGDTNFVPILGDTKVISESLESVYETLRRELPASSASRKKLK